MKKMRVLFLTAHKYLPEVRGGMETNTHLIAKRLIECGHVVGVVAQLDGSGYVGTLSRLKMKMLGTNSVRDSFLGYTTWRSWDTLSVCDHVFDAFRPDVVILQGGHNFIKLLEKIVRKRLPVVGYLHTADRLLLPADLANCPLTHFVANSRFTASLHPEKHFSAILPPLIPPRRYATVTNRSTAVFVNPRPHKGLAIVMELAKHRPDVSFLFVRAAGRVASEHEVAWHKNIRYVGPIRDMRSVYCKARLVLAPSICEETWGRIATEAHVSAIPVLASTQGGLPESVGEGGVCLPLTASVDQWCAAFNRLWDDEVVYQCLADAARAYSSRAEVDPDAIVSRLITVLCQAAAARRSPREGCGNSRVA